MPWPKLKELPVQVKITAGFPGTYKWAGGTSYYLITADGKWAPKEEIHFSLKKGGDNSRLADFHLTRLFTGSNVGIWYKPKGKYSNTNDRNLPVSKRKAYQDWIAANQGNCNRAAADFWNQLIRNATNN